SYDREAAISRKYISSFVLELDNIAQNLIRIEQFRDRIEKNRQQLRKYKRTIAFTGKKKKSFLGVKYTGKGRIYRRLDTYYSSYLTDKDMKTLEERTRDLLQPPGEPPISDREFAILKALAGNYVKANNAVIELREKLAEKEDGPEAEKIKKSLERASLNAQKKHYLLDQRITKLLAPSRKKKIVELGLDTTRFRIQTFPAAAVLSGDLDSPTLDTKIFNPGTPLNEDIKDDLLRLDLERAMHYMIESPEIQNDVSPIAVTFNQMDLQVLYSPHLRNPSSSIRLQTIAGSFSGNMPSELKEYIKKDELIGIRISDMSNLIKEKLEELKKARPPKPPGRNKEFKELYQKYNELLQERQALYDDFSKNNSGKLSPELIDAVGYIREAAIEDAILIYFENSPASYDEYMNSEKTRNYKRKRWTMIRNWIYAGTSETPPVYLQNQFKEGMIGFSRSEAEEIMWKLDSLPIASKENENVLKYIHDTNFGGIVRTLVDKTAGIQAIQSNEAKTLLFAQIITAVAILLTYLLSGFAVRKIKRISQNAEEVGKGNLNVEFSQKGWDEIGKLSQSLNHMVSGLNEREKIKGILGSMVDPVVIGEAMKDLQALKDGTEKNITAFFSDVAGFSTISEKLTSVQLASLLNEYLSAMTIILKEHEGVLDKYIGDAIVGIFNAPVGVDDHTLKAVRASVRMVEKMKSLTVHWHSEQKYIPEAWEMKFRIGLNLGPAKVGFMGTDALASYTMMGDSVNLAARLEAAAKDYGVDILASESVYEAIKDKVITRKLDLIKVKGKTEPVTIYEIITDDDKRTLDRGQKDSKILYEEGFELYLKKDWGNAIKKFQESEKIRGREDKAAQMLIHRIEEYRKSPPPDDWDGAYTRTHK
ncbi:MAG: adenylate/guanylate cyclase domain-containing protein, partial [Spirochaetia bacterium]|nr:adenylate/guanylate cyclase domain-containing protein [Spirochaetia bacterium]